MLEIAASIVGLTAFGTQIVGNLYRFGCNVSAAREQAARIGDRISDYVTILDVLESLIDQDPSLMSTKAEDMIDRLCEQSYDLFDEIKALLPHRRDKLKFKDKIAWNFRKAKVELMLGQIEYIKSNVLLLVMTTLLAKKIRRRFVITSHRWGTWLTSFAFRKKGNTSTKDQQEALDSQANRAENAVVQHMNAADKLESLEKKLELSDAAGHTSAAGDDSNALTVPIKSTAISLMSQQLDILADFQKSVASAPDASSRQTMMMSRSPQLIHSLLMEWTRVYEPEIASPGTGSQEREPKGSTTDQSSEKPMEPGSFVGSSGPVNDPQPPGTRTHDSASRHTREREATEATIPDLSSEDANVHGTFEGESYLSSPSRSVRGAADEYFRSFRGAADEYYNIDAMGSTMGQLKHRYKQPKSTTNASSATGRFYVPESSSQMSRPPAPFQGSSRSSSDSAQPQARYQAKSPGFAPRSAAADRYTPSSAKLPPPPLGVPPPPPRPAFREVEANFKHEDWAERLRMSNPSPSDPVDREVKFKHEDWAEKLRSSTK